MKKIVLTISIISIIIGIVGGFGISYWMKQNMKADIKVETFFYDLEWGMKRNEVENVLMAEGFTNMNKAAMSVFVKEDFEGVKGATARIACSYDSREKLTMVLVTFKSDDKDYKTNGSTIDALTRAYMDGFEKIMDKHVSLQEYIEKGLSSSIDVSYDINDMFVSDDSFVTVMAKDETVLMVAYENPNSDFAKLIKENFK